MSQRSLDRIRDVALWFHENRNRGRDYDKEREFLHVTIDCLLEITTHLLEDIQALEGKPREQIGRSFLWTPHGTTARRD